jgi:hypothetical protein
MHKKAYKAMVLINPNPANPDSDHCELLTILFFEHLLPPHKKKLPFFLQITILVTHFKTY